MLLRIGGGGSDQGCRADQGGRGGRNQSQLLQRSLQCCWFARANVTGSHVRNVQHSLQNSPEGEPLSSLRKSEREMNTRPEEACSAALPRGVSSKSGRPALACPCRASRPCAKDTSAL